MDTISEQIILLAAKKFPKNEFDFNDLKRLASKERKEQMPNKTELLQAYHKLRKEKRIKVNKEFEKLMTRRAVRTLSGVTIITSLVKPYPCPGECIYCPLDARMPKSYLAEEPAAMRALLLKFDPYEQMARRIEALEDNGHPTDKIELIIKGGTWNSYTLGYQYWFILESFRAANARIESPLKRGAGGVLVDNTSRPSSATLLSRRDLNERSTVEELRKELFKQQKINERAKHRIIGLTLETRPDCITEKTMWQMRELGCTRVELGVQHTDDKILKLTKRGHDSAAAKKATLLLRNFGYKVDFHLMPQLPGSTPQKDLKMLQEIFSDPGYRPDMIKIYPCTVVKGSELYDWFKAGKFKSYPTRKLIDILKIFKSTIPYYCRISRLIRDIPGQYIEEGNKVTNLRQVIAMEMQKEGLRCRCLRCREVGHFDIKTLEHENILSQSEIHSRGKTLKPKLFVDKYETTGGTEYFLSYEDKGRNLVYAFCRLRVLDRPSIPSLKRGEVVDPLLLRRGQGEVITPYDAFIRELHTYGQMMSIKQKSKKAKKQDKDVQHTGFGKLLMIEAEKIAKKNKAKNIAVISGVGVRGYYKKLGYKLERTYMVKTL